jgi:hypothetical protein
MAALPPYRTVESCPACIRFPHLSEERAGPGAPPGRIAAGLFVTKRIEVRAVRSYTAETMGNDLTVLVAEPPRMTSFRDELHLAGRVLRFSSSNLPSVFDSIRANQPAMVAVDAHFVETAPGKAFVERVLQLAIPALEVHLVVRQNGTWTTRPVAEPAPAPRVDLKSTGLNTRRAPRFVVIDPVQASVNTSQASLIDLSVLGAQVLSEPILKPNQAIKIALPDVNETLRVTARIKWSLFEKPNYATAAYYRAGVEFADATPALADYCRRHCAEDPQPYRAR